MNKKFSVKTIVILAGSYIATIIGSGFATGQEILQFFFILRYYWDYRNYHSNGFVFIYRCGVFKQRTSCEA